MKDNTTGLTLVPHAVNIERRAQDLLMTSPTACDPVVSNAGVWLDKWADEAPSRVFLAERSNEGWREMGYAEVRDAVHAIASSLVARGMDGSTPIVIMSGNSIDHALLSLAAQYAGIPTVPLAEQYSLITEAHERLVYVLNKIKPAMAFVDNASRYGAAISRPELAGVEIIASRTEGAPGAVTPFNELLRGDAGIDLASVHAKVGPDTLAKVLFTSGSSSEPKGVLTTQRMMCTNQAQMASVLPFLKERPPRIMDWLPWNHVFGGSHNTLMMLAHGGSLYIDNGKPTSSGFPLTVENIIEKPGTLSFNVPVGFAMLVQEMETNMALRNAYFRDLDMLFYAGASLPQDVWTRLEEMAIEVRGRLPLMISSWGMTETAPATIMVYEPIGRSGVIGLPLPDTEIKLIPDDDMRCELRVKGPNVMSGYWGDEEKSAAAFDEEGFLITGDAVRFVDADDPERGLVFDGRVSEDFKLLTGTWVQAGRLRLEVLEQLRGVVQDVVICGHDRGEIGLFVFPKPDQVHGPTTSKGAVIDPDLQVAIELRLRAMARASSGSAKRIARAIILAEPPSLKDGEITDKGSLNVRKIITRRADILERLYDNQDPALIRV
ncbi:Acyl-CoA synthetase (AMP-forming)/AMP-acid ligase II [Hoeflea phototrophica DFL-43]|uniref:Acyl-CoA synthetase (AMP-forming)/AMP-acid ligase II n=1 Tax=Hoeflea phototrophica (strain DSM 17068 / NCIMB 14078 / DFL-43) TaxID=411684 RepID=A9CZE1_HOEPD|nr:feruloyl-CoA synthase [Hoeflea phototrophica]EDQ34753.1 Acyl-CoA synthetase (AMP-forming)/AMP-acid ligase II [Hoeflea phototrophica DFL-43]